jgi:2',3'-cyclic-nucleotide 2'-phosphodiesterase (5'-nucleotidase family)
MRATVALLVVAGCASMPPGRPTGRVTISIAGTSDIHGHMTAEGDMGGFALLGGYLANLRAARAADGGGVLLLDGGDDWQGTMESNLAEGEGVIDAMNQLGYNAMAIGNHDFDYGPVGPRIVASKPGDDPRGALKMNAKKARFPFLTANIYETATGRPLAAPNIMPSTIVEVDGVRIGVVGAATTDTPTSTMAANFQGLTLEPLAPAIAGEAAALRARGAQVVALVTHAGLCNRSIDNELQAHCTEGEIVDVVHALPKGAVDVVIGGHTHMGASLEVNGVPIVEAWKYGHGLARVDLTIENGRIVGKKMFDPVLLCARVVAGTQRCDKDAPAGPRVPATYEGRPVVPDAAVAAAIAPYIDRAAAQRDERLGVRVASTLVKSYDEESPFGNLVADLMRAARPKADLALTNGGGLRADLPVGELTYGQVYTTYPFDNRFAEVDLPALSFRALMKDNIEHSKGILSVSGVRVKAVCQGSELVVTLTRDDGRPIRDDERLRIATSDFLASGGEGPLGGAGGAVAHIEEGTLVREDIISVLRERGGVLSGDDKTIFDPAHRRVDYPGQRPVRCPR